MRIGIVLSKPPGYSETFFNSKIKGLLNKGFEVELFVQSCKSDYSMCKVHKAYPIIKRNPILQLGWFIWVYLKLLFHLKPVLKYIQLELADGVGWNALFKKLYINAPLLTQQLDWLHFGFATMALGKENVAKAIGAKMAISLRGFDIAIYPVKNPNCYDLLWRKVDKVHTISNDLYKLAIKNGLGREVSLQKITPAIDVMKFKGSNQRLFDVEPLKIITVARLHWKKGLTDTFEALKILKEKGIFFNYTLVGDGEEYEKLMFLRYQLGLVNEVNIIGKVSNDRVKELLSQHDIFVQYSRSEGFCNAVLEAQAMGLLCIVSDAEGLSENVLDNKSGWVVEQGNSIILAKQIIKVSNLSLEEKDNIRRFAINRVQNEFNLEKQQQEFLKFYTE